MWLTVSMILLAYLMGSVCTAIIVCRVMGLTDPRTVGSANPGSTNVLRIGGKFPAALTLIGDAVKALFPVLLAKYLGVSGIYLGFVALAAFLGHLYPIFFGFKGGKGVATSLGCLLGLYWPLALLGLATWMVVVAIFRISSLGALVGTLSTLLYTLVLAPSYFIPVAIMAGLVFYAHRENIQNLMRGTET